MKTMKIEKEEAALVLIDFQERLMLAMRKKEKLAISVTKLARGCKIMGLPILVTQQYTRGLGPTISGLHEVLGEYDPIEKTSFSAMKEQSFVKALAKTGRKDIILAGIESHVCVQQTALDLLEQEYNVFLVADCVSSRRPVDQRYALKRMAQAGVIATTYEAVLFELCVGSHLPAFKEISLLVK